MHLRTLLLLIGRHHPGHAYSSTHSPSHKAYDSILKKTILASSLVPLLGLSNYRLFVSLSITILIQH